MTPEQTARLEIDRLLSAADWHVCGVSDASIHAARGVAIREFPLAAGHGFADYLFYVDGKAAGVFEAKKAGAQVDAGYWLQVLDKPTGARRDWQFDDDFEYAPEELGRNLQTPDQIRTIVLTLRDNWKTDFSPQRQEPIGAHGLNVKVPIPCS